MSLRSYSSALPGTGGHDTFVRRILRPAPLATGGLVCLLLAAVLLAGGAIIHPQRIDRSSQAHVRELARTLADRLDRRMLTLARQASLIVRIDPTSGAHRGDLDATRGVFEQIQAADNHVLWMGLAGSDGKIEVATGALR